MKKPNILYIHTHDTGRFIEPYGYKVPSPGLMEFAKTGLTFTQAFNCGPTCSPSRAGLLTGQSPHACGMLGLAHRGFSLNDYSKHLCQFLGRNGYHTILSGIQHVINHTEEEKLGYHRILSVPKVELNINRNDQYEKAEAQMRHDAARSRAACDFLMEKHDRPFFLSAGFFGTHRPFPKASSKYNPNYIKVPENLPNTPAVRKDMSEYMELLEQTDQNIAAVLRTLERQGLADSTVVIFTTDHGIAFPGMKCTLKDTGIGVSLILRAPGITKAGTVTDSLVSHIDIFPTLCDLAGLEKPDRLEGTSLMPILSGNREEVREEIFSEVTFHAAYEPKRCIRTKRYKLIEYFDSYEKVIGPNTDDGYSKRTLMEYGYLDRKRNGRFALYDLIFDPGETDNLAAESEYKGLQDELSRRLHDWMERTNDPLLKGPVPKPDGAVINKKSSIHPSDNTYE